jgi:hypothetical protein
MIKSLSAVVALAGFISIAPAPASGAVNSLTITEKAGTTTTNYPIQIGRPFVQGEIANFPQALVGGAPVTTQADVKQRWSDGSVKHAILTFLIPTLSSGSTVTVTFRNQSSCNCGSGARLSKTQMLDAATYNFDARMELTSGSTVAASARAMLNADAFSYWLEGGVATSVILADHSTARAFDIGFDSNRSFRPVFHATFWPAIKKVRVRFIGENANTEAIQDQTYSLALKLGNTSPAQVYSKSAVPHYGATRWTKEFWIGGAPSEVAINHNLNYIRETRFSYNFDTTKTIPSTKIVSGCNAWQSAARDLYDGGNWQKFMPNAGGRSDIGPYPEWVIDWLFTGDKCLEERAFGNADLAAAWNIHFREGKTNKPFLRSDTGSTGLGRVLSLTARPTVRSMSLTYSGTSATDQITPVGPATNGGWVYDPAHEPDVASIIYALSGDFWYLEEMWFWASADAAANPPTIWERGPDGRYGVVMQVQMRASAWIIRNRVNTAFISPDGTPEKLYFETLISDEIATEEGIRNITGTPFQGNASWNWGRNTMAPAWRMDNTVGLPPLRQWRRGESDFAQSSYGVDTNVTSEAVSLFEQDYLMLALGRGKELGYAFGPLVSWLAPQYINIVTNSQFNPYIAANGRMPTNRKSDGKYFSTWAELKTGYDSRWQNATSFIENQPPGGYAALFLAATSMVAGESGGAAAWSWVQSKILSDAGFNFNPSWAILPRSGSVTPPAQVSCDINTDGRVDLADVQLSIDQSLGAGACGTADLDQNGKCNIIDVQRAINAALGGVCRTDP